MRNLSVENVSDIFGVSDDIVKFHHFSDQLAL